MLTERTRRGRLFWARQGRVNWGGTPTYGYRLFRGTEAGPQQMAVERCEAAVVRQIYRWLVEEQLSSYAIQKRLIERGVPTRGVGAAGRRARSSASCPARPTRAKPGMTGTVQWTGPIPA